MGRPRKIIEEPETVLVNEALEPVVAEPEPVVVEEKKVEPAVRYVEPEKKEDPFPSRKRQESFSICHTTTNL